MQIDSLHIGAIPFAVVIGSLTQDRIVYDHNQERRVGGVVWYAGGTLAQLGIRTRVLTRLASEDSRLAEPLHSLGVDVWLRSSAHTTTFVNTYAAGNLDDRSQQVLTLADPIEADDILRGTRNANLVYLGPLHPKDISEEGLAILNRDKAWCLALDVQGYTREVYQTEVYPKLYEKLPWLLQICDVIKANEDEAMRITGFSDPVAAARQLANEYPNSELVVTCGSRGVYVASKGNLHYEPAERVEVSDPTGAGDIFFANYLAQRLFGFPVAEAASFASGSTAKQLSNRKRFAKPSKLGQVEPQDQR